MSDSIDWVVIDESVDPAMFEERSQIRWVAPIVFVSARDISWIYDTFHPSGDADRTPRGPPLAPLPQWLEKLEREFPK